MLRGRMTAITLLPWTRHRLRSKKVQLVPFPGVRLQLEKCGPPLPLAGPYVREHGGPDIIVLINSGLQAPIGLPLLKHG